MSRKRYSFAELVSYNLTEEELVEKLCGDVTDIVAALEKIKPDMLKNYTATFEEMSNRFERFSNEGGIFH